MIDFSPAVQTTEDNGREQVWPLPTDEESLRDEPAFSQLELWDRLRAEFLWLDPDPLDRSGKGFRHG